MVKPAPRPVIFLWLVISLFLLAACSNEDQLTGGPVVEVSTLDVIVRSENGSFLAGAEI